MIKRHNIFKIQTANENVRQCLEYLCEKLNNIGTKLH